MNEVIKPISKRVLQETHYNPMRVSRVQIQFLWQPHNYRLYFDFDKTKFNPPKPDNPTLKKLEVGLVGFKYETKNYNSEHHFNNFYGCRIIIKKNMAEVINKWYEKQWKLIVADNVKDVDKRIEKNIKEMDEQCVDALSKIIRLFGGDSRFKILKRRGEHGIHGDDYLDKIPEDMIIHDTVFKKVYPKKVEFFDPASIKNYVSNRAIENIAPEIAQELTLNRELIKGVVEINASTSKLFNKFSNTFLPTFTEFSKDVKVHNKVLKGIDKSFNKFNRRLSLRQTQIYDFK